MPSLMLLLLLKINLLEIKTYLVVLIPLPRKIAFPSLNLFRQHSALETFHILPRLLQPLVSCCWSGEVDVWFLFTEAGQCVHRDAEGSAVANEGTWTCM